MCKNEKLPSKNPIFILIFKFQNKNFIFHTPPFLKVKIPRKLRFNIHTKMQEEFADLQITLNQCFFRKEIRFEPYIVIRYEQNPKDMKVTDKLTKWRQESKVYIVNASFLYEKFYWYQSPLKIYILDAVTRKKHAKAVVDVK